MKTTFKCKKCGEENEISEALTRQIHDEVIAAERVKHEEELESVRKQAEQDAGKKLESQYELTVKNLTETANEEKDRNKALLKQLEDLNTEIRGLRRKDEERDLQMKKTIAEEEEKIRLDARRQAESEHQLKDREKDKKLSDLEQQLKDAQIKLQQGSQQTQGEILELEIESLLRDTFAFDLVDEIKKGQNGADIRQTVCSRNGTKCGVILWEFKNYQKNWSDSWLSKLKQDQRNESADVAILVSSTIPNNMQSDMEFRDGVWVCKPSLVVPLATALRDRLHDVARQKAIGEHRGKKADLMFDYITGTEFRQQVEAMVEVHQEMKDQIDRERKAYESSWKKREQQLNRYLLGLAGVCGNVQGIAGQSSIPTFKGLDVLELESGL